jgi:hypothetical protein
MKSRFLSPLLWAATLLAGNAVESERSYLSSTGQEIKATFQSLKETTVTLRRSDGKVFDIPLDRLSEADQAYILEASSKGDKEAEPINLAAGQELADGTPLDQRDAAELAAALNLRPESTSKHGRSWRLYAAFVKDYLLFGTMPYSVALYSDEDGKVQNLSVVYANKGDFGSTAGFARDHFKNSGTKAPGSLTEAMNLDEELISKALASVFGEGSTQRYGEGQTRRKVTRWDWNGHSFLLSNVEGEYVGLSVVATDTANGGGKSARMTDADLKKRLTDNLVRKDNGDVLITEIPMVDQGPKGYCVPATFERSMRTMGIEADMYLLAMVGQSSAGGGTVVEILLENVKSAVYRKGRRTREDEIKQLRIRDIKRYIDQGTPVMWTMFSVEDYNDIADANTESRASESKVAAKEIEAKATEVAAKAKPESNGHLCMIIGYNEITNEIAVSDSWGPHFELRWVPLAVADWVSGGKIFMILP